MASKALVKAVTSGRLTQARLMVKMGADVNFKDEEGQTPIIRALHLPNLMLRSRFLRLLLKAGALVSVADTRKMNAVMWACRVGRVQDLALLLHHADVDLDLNAQNADGQTAQWMAVEGNRVEMVQELIRALAQHEVNFEVADRAGVTPSQLAAQRGHFRCLRAMIWQVESVGKSINTLINMSKVGQILNSSNMTDTLERISEVTPPEKSLQPPVSELPGIQVTSEEGHPVLDLCRAETQLADDSEHSLSSLKAPSTSTSNATTQMSVSQSLIQARPTRTAPRQKDHHHHRKTSLRLSLLDNETPAAEHDSSHRVQHQSSQENPSQRRPSSTSKVSGHEPSGNAGGVFSPPVGHGRQERRSVKQTLPRLLDIHAQNLSASFRRPAVVKPPTPKPEPPPPTAWCKRKEVAFIARLKRADSLTPVDASTAAAVAAIAAAAAAVTGGGDGAAAAAAGHDSTAGGLARLLLSKRRLAVNIKQRSG